MAEPRLFGEKMNTAVYIDALNLYYGCVRGTKWKWLDVGKAVEASIEAPMQVHKIKYFTARIDGRVDQDAPRRQDVYLRAIRSHDARVEIIEGKFKRHKKRYPEVNSGIPTSVWVPEEKGSDVNFCVHLLHDAWRDQFERAILVTNDSDMAEAIRLVRSQFPDKELVLLPPGVSRNPSKNFRQFVTSHFWITPNIIQNAQLPNPIINNPRLSKPEAWNTVY